MTNTYINNVNLKTKKQELKEIYIFGYSFGIFLTLFFTIMYLLNTNNLMFDNFYFIGFGFGILVILSTIFYPPLLKYPKMVINKLINGVFFTIFLLLLTLIYYICIFPIGIIIKIINNKNKNNKNIDTTFVTKTDSNKKHAKGRNILIQILHIFSFFAKKEYAILLPTIILIIIIGLIFVFLQSNLVAPFIYTLF